MKPGVLSRIRRLKFQYLSQYSERDYYPDEKQKLLISDVPFLSTFNGPSFLLHAVQRMHDLGVPRANIRLLPVLGHYAEPEIVSYKNIFAKQFYFGEELKLDEGSSRTVHPTDWTEHPALQPKQWSGENLQVRLGVNARFDDRLFPIAPLITVGFLKKELFSQRDHSLFLGEWARQMYHQEHERLLREGLDWMEGEPPVLAMARQLTALYPAEFRDIDLPPWKPSETILLYHQGAARDVLNTYLYQPPDYEGRDKHQGIVARELMEQFFTEAFLILAGADLIGGFDYIYKVEPNARDIDLEINALSPLRDVLLWYKMYPHLAIPPARLDGMSDEQRRDWEKFYQENPPKDETIFEAISNLWTEHDPAFKKIDAEIKGFYEKGRQEPVSSTEMLTLASKHLPEYEPHYPRQIGVVGGLNLPGIVLHLIASWINEDEETGFMGVRFDQLSLFSAEQQIALCAMLMQRRQVVDYAGLFRIAVQCLIHEEIEVWHERYEPYPSEMGTPLAQLGKSLVIKGSAAFHKPFLMVYIPLDRTQSPDADLIEEKLGVLIRLFLPLHLSADIKVRWKVDWAILGETAYLQGYAGPNEFSMPRPGARLEGAEWGLSADSESDQDWEEDMAAEGEWEDESEEEEIPYDEEDEDEDGKEWDEETSDSTDNSEQEENETQQVPEEDFDKLSEDETEEEAYETYEEPDEETR